MLFQEVKLNQIPSVNELNQIFSASRRNEAANAKTFNIDHPAVEFLLQKYARSATLDEKKSILRALDRVLLSENYAVPIGVAVTQRLAWRQGFHHPGGPTPPDGSKIFRSWWHE